MNVKASVNYHIKSHEPQAFLFDVDGIAGNLIAPALVETEIDVQDIRGKACNVNFKDDGILFVEHMSSITHFDNDNDDWQAQYDEEIITLLTHNINAQEVIVFDHTIRVDNVKSERKPARNVHNDYSPKGANQRLIDLLGRQGASEFQKGSFGFVNVWRPIEHTITRSPLGFIRPSSMRTDDWMAIELVYPDRMGQILGVASNPNHEWFYQSNMQVNETIIFNIYDNSGRPHLAHSALDINECDIDGQNGSLHPRKSIETRTLVRYG